MKKLLASMWATLALAAAPAWGTDGEWHSLFNGRDLTGWTVKINKHPLGENHANTFRVEDGILKVGYDGYGKFDERFGHLYSNLAYSHYVLRLEYRITGTAVADAPPWAKLNSGVMIHAQSPLTLGLNASSKLFPVDEWVAVEVEVHGNDEVIHRVNGAEVLRYQRPQLDPRDDSAKALLAAGAPLQLSFGHIALQAESQPVWFRNIRIRPLAR